MSWQEPLNLVGGAGESIVLKLASLWHFEAEKFFFPFFLLKRAPFWRPSSELRQPDCLGNISLICIRLVYCIKKKSCYKCIGIQTSHRTHEHPDRVCMTRVSFTLISPCALCALAWFFHCTLQYMRTLGAMLKQTWSFLQHYSFICVASRASWTANPVNCYWFHDYGPCFAGSYSCSCEPVTQCIESLIYLLCV